MEVSEEERLLQAVRDRPGSPTYVIANRIGLRGQTALVRRRLKRLEADGKIRSGTGDHFVFWLSWWAT